MLAASIQKQRIRTGKGISVVTKKWKFLFEKSELFYCELYHICGHDTSKNNLHSEQTKIRTIKTVTKDHNMPMLECVYFLFKHETIDAAT